MHSFMHKNAEEHTQQAYILRKLQLSVALQFLWEYSESVAGCKDAKYECEAPQTTYWRLSLETSKIKLHGIKTKNHSDLLKTDSIAIALYADGMPDLKPKDHLQQHRYRSFGMTGVNYGCDAF
ncbi:hypothetical protein ILUMI_24218, partial [Ignelater luminosus]